MKTVVVLQSNYIPWKGYFDLIHDADTFIFYDDVQYTKNDWRNRNRIKTNNGAAWLTIPVGGSTTKLINEIKLPQSGWKKKHWKTIGQHYSKTPYFDHYRPFFEEAYTIRNWDYLSQFNQYLIKSIAKDVLGIDVCFENSSDYSVKGRKQDRLLSLLVAAKAERYVSGPAARSYINEQEFADKGIQLHYKDYSGYPEYQQAFPSFIHNVSIIDLIFNVGPQAPEYIWGWREKSGSRQIHDSI